MFYFDPLYFLFALPALLLGFYAQMKVQGAVNKYSQVGTMRGVTGAQVARILLDSEGLSNVQIEETQGFLSDHYDPRSDVLRLSPDVYRGQSIAAAGIAAHEMGHALQDARSYAPLALRSAMVPTVQFGSWLGPLIFIAGFILQLTPLAWVGLILFAAVAVFAVVTLPVEFDASRRAKQLLVSRGVLVGQELQGVNAVLDAAALTYVAGAAQAVSTLLYYAFLLMGRRDD
ncbi:MAG: zinc metallopeptidase [Ardenticatenaceae bacterium]|nr:zinc metallopeptidase [Ardenticatenaceae bacterium]HBY94195.1 zinc metallopeptidase [Chloroflexota bacterium]